MRLITAATFFLFLLVLLSSCGAIDRNARETRKITAWGFWGVIAGNPVGIGYWHSEVGPSKDIESEQSARPPAPVL